MAAYITVLNYVYSLCVGLFYYSVLSCVADVADCPLQRLSAIVIKNIIIIIIFNPSVLNSRKHYYYYLSSVGQQLCGKMDIFSMCNRNI